MGTWNMPEKEEAADQGGKETSSINDAREICSSDENLLKLEPKHQMKRIKNAREYTELENTFLRHYTKSANIIVNTKFLFIKNFI